MNGTKKPKIEAGDRVRFLAGDGNEKSGTVEGLADGKYLIRAEIGSVWRVLPANIIQELKEL